MAYAETHDSGKTPKPRKGARGGKRQETAAPDAARLMKSGDAAGMDAAFEAMSPEARKEVFDGIGKDVARVLGAEALGHMLRDSGMSGREIDARFGYDHAALSRTANGKSVSGPTLWRLFALAEALGFDIELKVTKRT
ncbi:hypothetical protein ATO6_08890 [Oceanicola sp. 22II-s10i]|uniref:hypothetical protein n=1 Tax=Oceanicola sp. 22II-s10i TaxID=1317116 RepID=UPI000B5288E7|nr:hypothetical protein [Oceanicola sp. 22II-s10i]OWU85147.1 hypothetical protein ATO6_08890 [Oceanicola sp. 22II-s10i]